MRNACNRVGSRLTSAFPQHHWQPSMLPSPSQPTNTPSAAGSWSLLSSIFNDGFQPSSPLLPHLM